MRTLREVETLLGRLDECVADDLEAQDLDFAEWVGGDDDAFRRATDRALCMENGGGGVVFGVADAGKGRAPAVRGVPPEVDLHRLKRAVYDRTDPRSTPVIEEIRVPEGTGRLVVMFVYDGIPPYTDTAGRGLVRVGKDCRPLTGSLRRKLEARWNRDDFTAEIVPGRPRTRVHSGRETGRNVPGVCPFGDDPGFEELRGQRRRGDGPGSGDRDVGMSARRHWVDVEEEKGVRWLCEWDFGRRRRPDRGRRRSRRW